MRAHRVKDSKGTVRNHEHDITIFNIFFSFSEAKQHPNTNGNKSCPVMKKSNQAMSKK